MLLEITILTPKSSIVRDAIPRECFGRSTLRGLGYVVRDITLFVTTLYLFNRFATPEYISSLTLRTILWSLYGFINGLFLTGLWMLAHEVGILWVLSFFGLFKGG